MIVGTSSCLSRAPNLTPPSEGIPCDIRIGAPIDGWQPNPDIVRNRMNAGDPLRGDLLSS
jgi:hypothetical protein